jgi:hypothetical protein
MCQGMAWCRSRHGVEAHSCSGGLRCDWYNAVLTARAQQLALNWLVGGVGYKAHPATMACHAAVGVDWHMHCQLQGHLVKGRVCV